MDNSGNVTAAVPRRGLSGSTLKIIAIITMMIDHLAATVLMRMLVQAGIWDVMQGADLNQMIAWMNENMVLYMSYSVMRMIGRLGFPIFCFLLIEGFQKTRNVKKYALRLGAFALLSEIPFDLAFHSKVLEFSYQNVFFTLFIGLLTMIAFEQIGKLDMHKAVKVILDLLALAAGMAAAQLLKTDYAAIGIVCIMVMYLFRKRKVAQIIAGCVVFLWELTAPLAFLPIGFYNGKRGLNLKYVFYAFYPAHLLILYLISVLMGLGSIPAL